MASLSCECVCKCVVVHVGRAVHFKTAYWTSESVQATRENGLTYHILYLSFCLLLFPFCLFLFFLLDSVTFCLVIGLDLSNG